MVDMAALPGRTLAQQLKQLDSEDRNDSIDVDSSYSSIEAHGKRGVEREHYLDVGPSKLRREVDSTGLGQRYEGKRVGRMKIFEDDDEDEDAEDVEGDGEDDGEENDGEEDEDDGEDEAEDEDRDEEEDEEGDGSEDEDEDGEEEDAEQTAPTQPPTSLSRALNPLSSLREARMKDIEKGKAIRRQKALFESLLTLRITFQKALIASSSIPQPFPENQPDDTLEKKQAALQSLSELSETLFQLREGISLPDVQLGKRKRGDDVSSEEYWQDAGRQSLEMVDETRVHMLPILNKWSTKIQAASIQVGGKQGSSKFLQSTKGGTGIIEAIEAGLASRRDSGKTLLESEEAGYRALLREVIEARSGGASSGIDLTHLRKEKKKKREAERGGSKGRKLRYTVHDKAQNFTVAAELPGGWHDEQIDELFSSLLGGAGIRGATTQKTVIPGGTDSGVADGSEGGLAGLGGLRVF